MPIGSGGDAITFSKRLTRANVRTPLQLADYIRRNLAPTDPRPTFGHVLKCSVHHYLLRSWLASGEIHPDRDVKLCVLPPPQMADHLRAGHLDGCCVGEPWNTLALLQGAAEIVALTTDSVPDHPDKVLAVSGALASGEPDVVVRLVRAVLRGAAWCEQPANHEQLAVMLAGEAYLDVDPVLIRESLAIEKRVPTRRVANRRGRSFQGGASELLAQHVRWPVSQMQRWGHVDASLDVASLIARCAPGHFLESALNVTSELELAHV
jgi:two-component system, oxyanion-binding sensor